jgi:hypothetical protein
MAGGQDDRPRVTALVKMLHQIKTGHARHPHVGDGAIELLASIERFQEFLCGLESRCADGSAR